MAKIRVFLKGWVDGREFARIVNDPTHPRHAEAMGVHARSFRPYKAGDLVYLAHEYEDTGESHHDILERAFYRFNVGDEHGDREALAYRRKGHRSLSVGDVVEIDGTVYGCESIGWQIIPSCDL